MGNYFAVTVAKCHPRITFRITIPPPLLLFVDYLCNIVCYDMSEVAETETLQLQIEELSAQLNTVGIAEAGSVPRSQTKDVSLVTGIQEWTV